METKKIPFEEIYDIYAVRVIFDNDDDEKERVRCWEIYTFFTDGHSVHPDRLRDWTSTPKANGYRALHLTAMGPDGKWIEVQIRSKKMDEIAELGYAAHWRYKTGERDDDSELDKWMNTIKDILANPEPNAIDFLDTIKLNLFASEIYVFTPKGDLLTLPAGATVLDMAFAIHTELGIHCIAGKINHRLVPLSYQLDSGDQVEIITSRTQSPQPEWMEMCHSARAKNALRTLLRKDTPALAEHGKRLFEEFLSRENIPLSDQLVRRVLDNYRLDTPEALYLKLAGEEIALSPTQLKAANKKRLSMLRKLVRNPFAGKNKKKVTEEQTNQPIDRKKIYVLHPDSTPPNYRIDTCCAPVPGDDVLGFVDDNEQVVLHKVSCPEAMRLKSSYGSRLVATQWGGVARTFPVSIEVEGIDRRGILSEITSTLTATLNTDLRALNIGADKEVFKCSATLLVDTTYTIDNILRALKSIKGVKIAQRVS